MKVNNKEVCVITRCPICGHANEVEVNEIDYLDWQDGMTVQEAFPYLSPEEREKLISGICPTCWDSLFEEPEDNETFEKIVDDFSECEIGFNPYMGCYDYDC